MCKFENVLMCKCNRNVLSVFALCILFCFTVYGQTPAVMQQQYFKSVEFSKLISEQNYDSITTLLSKELQNDPSVKASLSAAYAIIEKADTASYWFYNRENSKTMQCAYLNNEVDMRAQLLIVLTFGTNDLGSTIVSVQILNEEEMKKQGIDPAGIAMPPPSFEMPAPKCP